MFLKKINLLNYKNFDELNIIFDAKINCFVGENGVGKTNLLDAIYYLTNGKSYFNPIAIQNIKHTKPFFLLNGIIQKNKKDWDIVCSLKKGAKKVFKRNKKTIEKLSDFFGFIPIVIISPYDNNLILEGSESRRKFIDSIIAQSDKVYLKKLITYSKIVQQRNAMLRFFSTTGTFDKDSIEAYDTQLIALGDFIFSKRKDFIELFVKKFQTRFSEIMKFEKKVDIVYKSQLMTVSMKELLADSIEIDKTLKFTSKGVHKDDFICLLNTYPIKKFGSQGEQKIFLMALKLAQFDFLKEKEQLKPLLLLDDIFDKLDEKRVQDIIHLINKDEFGQIFITDTHPKRIEKIMKALNQSYKTLIL